MVIFHGKMLVHQRVLQRGWKNKMNIFELNGDVMENDQIMENHRTECGGGPVAMLDYPRVDMENKRKSKKNYSMI